MARYKKTPPSTMARISPAACITRLPYRREAVTFGGFAIPPTGSSSLS